MLQHTHNPQVIVACPAAPDITFFRQTTHSIKPIEKSTYIDHSTCENNVNKYVMGTLSSRASNRNDNHSIPLDD
jgi:hypothetical protein